MADSEDAHVAPTSSVKPRISYACEACRVAKVKCQPGNAEGICRRCGVSKRECVFKLGPRTRRRRSKLHPAATRSTPPPSAPSKTFTIDVPVQAEEGFDEDPSLPFETLRETHEEMLRNLVDADEFPGERVDLSMTDAPSSTSGSRAFSTPTPSITSRPVHGFSNIQPQFNLDSAATLLASFKDSMLPYFPVMVLPSDISVPALAKERPFVLLAILAAASGGKSLQGHNLYDEEFRKVLGLKFVSSGERSVELLVGLLIYCAWYPFHLRPKNKQASQYIRMASDMVRDLELDQPHDNINLADTRTNADIMNDMRAYLAAQYLCSGFSVTWQKTQSLPFQKWTTTCCDLFADNEDSSASKADQTLAWLVRLQHLVTEIAHLNKRGGGRGREQDEEQHIALMMKGMEAQLGEFQAQMSPDISSQPVLHMAALFTEIIIYGSPLLRHPYERPKKRNPSSSSSSSSSSSADTPINPDRLMKCATLLRTWYDYILSLPTSEFSHLPGAIWAHLVASIILGLRLSFPLPHTYLCSGGWDHATARRILDFGGFITQFSEPCDEGSSDSLPNLAAPANSTCKKKTTTSTDVLSASKVVINMVKQKYEKRLAALEIVQAAPHPGQLDGLDDRRSMMMNKCPMLDGSLDQYVQDWDERFFDPMSGLINPVQDVSAMDEYGYSEATTSVSGSQSLVYHDLWATMTMGWSQDAFGSVDFDA